MKRYHLWLIALCALLTACGSTTPASNPQATVPPQPAATPAPSEPDADADTPAPAPSGDLLVTLRSSGGIASIESVFHVWNDGRLELTNTGPNLNATGTGSVDPSQLAELRTLLGSDDFAQLDASYAPADNCCDLMTHVIETPARSVTTTDGTENPVILQLILSKIYQLQPNVTMTQ